LEISHRPLEHVAGAIELVIVAEIAPALVDLATDIPAVQIAVRKLSLGEVLDDRVDLGLDSFVTPMREGIARRLDPFAYVGIPEDLRGEIMAVPGKAKRRRGLRNLERLEIPVIPQPLILAGNRLGEHGVEPLAPECVLHAHVGE